MVGSNIGPITLNSTTVDGPIEFDGYIIVYHSKLDLNGNDVYDQLIIVDQSSVSSACLTQDPKTKIMYLSFSTSSD